MRKLITVCAVVMFFGTNYAMAGGTTLNKPGATSTQITDIDGNNTVGQYKTSDDGYDHAFLYNVDGKSWITLDQTGSIGARPEDISGNKVVGINLLSGTTSNVFLYDVDKQTWVNFDIPGRSGVNGILGSNVVGGYLDGTIHHGFLYDGTNWTKFEPIERGWTSSYPVGVSDNKVVGSYYIGDTKHGFLYDGDTQIWTTLDMPGFPGIFPLAVSGNNIVGNYQHDGNLMSGFLYDGKNWITLDVPGATRTNVSDISGNNIIGSYDISTDNYQHSFLYDITKDPKDPLSWTNIDMLGAKNTLVNAIDGSDIVGYHMSSPAQGYFYTIPEPSTLVLLIAALISSFVLYRKFNY